MQIHNGSVPCELCGIDYAERYNLDAPLIDCHHLTPLADLGVNTNNTTLDDLVLVCPTCHRALHMSDDCSDLDPLRLRIESLLSEE